MAKMITMTGLNQRKVVASQPSQNFTSAAAMHSCTDCHVGLENSSKCILTFSMIQQEAPQFVVFIAGYTLCNTPALGGAIGEAIRWHVAALGSEASVHNFHWCATTHNDSLVPTMCTAYDLNL
jgi:hypothetical protein